jgi:hypothetical protein
MTISTAKAAISAIPAEKHQPSFRGASKASEPGISRFPDVQLHI